MINKDERYTINELNEKIKIMKDGIAEAERMKEELKFKVGDFVRKPCVNKVGLITHHYGDLLRVEWLDKSVTRAVANDLIRPTVFEVTDQLVDLALEYGYTRIGAIVPEGETKSGDVMNYDPLERTFSCGGRLIWSASNGWVPRVTQDEIDKYENLEASYLYHKRLAEETEKAFEEYKKEMPNWILGGKCGVCKCNEPKVSNE